MSYTIEQIATALGAEAVGDVALKIASVAEPAQASSNQLALAMKPEFAAQLSEGNAVSAMLWEGADWQGFGLKAAILAPRPRFAMAGLSAMMDPTPRAVAGVHASAIVDPASQLGDGVSIGPLAVIEAGAQIGAGAQISAQVFIGRGAVIGENAILREGVRIGAGVSIGARFIAQPGATIGGDGFSFVTPEVGAVERARDSLGDQGDIKAQSWTRIYSLGSVQIGDDVEIGANSCIDRGTVRDTIVGNGCKFDNLAQVGHNVVIGNDCMICAQVGIAGSTRIGNNVVLGGQTGVSDNVFVGDNVITGGATKVLANVPAGRVMLGYPAVKMDKQIEIHKLLRRLPRLFSDVTALKKDVSNARSTD
ncbi:UDP-3-O-(3-hydroxymyristoyl)glucosamine N-acyltransferase [Planktotalea sp.]|uniref:UDP-3-O-(3-hydroxymyristoyl)glucosamine N-acyltransferase n=1 Tax=Planktotalea sp. TaxID=2029877 RepID=UPI003D6C1D98